MFQKSFHSFRKSLKNEIIFFYIHKSKAEAGDTFFEKFEKDFDFLIVKTKGMAHVTQQAVFKNNFILFFHRVQTWKFCF